VGDFRREALKETEHRPWPIPGSPWILTQTWHDLLFAHWSVDRHPLLARIPSPLDLDLHEDRAWIGVVSFDMTNVAPRMVPALPWISAFPEINVRTYVSLKGKPGVYFFSLDAANPVAVWVARTLFQLPYYRASVEVDRHREAVTFRSRRTRGEARFDAVYRPIGPVSQPERGSLAYFLTERYCLYTVDGRGRASRLDIHHPPWSLQPAEADIHENTMTRAADLDLPAEAPLLHFARRQDTVAWPPTRA
jgi:uncharacterized protein YqjF (DUF2071 family)